MPPSSPSKTPKVKEETYEILAKTENPIQVEPNVNEEEQIEAMKRELKKVKKKKKREKEEAGSVPAMEDFPPPAKKAKKKKAKSYLDDL